MANPLTQFGLTDLELHAAIAKDPVVIAELQHKAHEIETAWKELAPVFGETGKDERRESPPHDEPGAYRDSIHTEPMRARDGLPAMRVGTDDFKAVWIEVGTRHMPEYAPATKVAHEFGDTTGPIMSEGVREAQGRLREAIETLGAMRAAGAAERHIAAQQTRVNQARLERSAAFKAARRGRRR